MKVWASVVAVACWLGLGLAGLGAAPGETPPTTPLETVYVIPIREDINPPLTYIVRRGVKEAMEAGAGLLVLDMDTNGGRVDVTEEIIAILDNFPGETVTYVNRKAFSAGSFIAVATQRIFMADEAVIGAAAPMLMLPGGGPAQLPESVEAKMTSGIKALIRAKAEKNGHNVQVIEAMIDRNVELKMDGEVINPKGQILTLTSREATREFGNPPKPLLAEAIVPTLEDLVEQLRPGSRMVVRVEPTGVERIAFWINMVSPLLLALGIVGIYMEFKTPGFGVPGIVAIVALLLYFLGGYIAGLSGIEWVGVFALGVILIAVEIFFFPGTLICGIGGALLVLVSLIMAWTDLYPGMPTFPSIPQLHLPFRNLAIAMVLSIAAFVVAGRFLPKTAVYGRLVSQGTSGSVTDTRREREQALQLGLEGVTVSVLRPGGKAAFGDQLIDVVTRGEMLPRGARVRIIGHSAGEAVVEAVEG
jgi:membrane-bound serine protease (ClpP class)